MCKTESKQITYLSSLDNSMQPRIYLRGKGE